MNAPRKLLVVFGLTAMLASAMPSTFVAPAAAAERYSSSQSRNGFNDEYIFATTRGVNDWDDVHPALKLTLFPVTIVLDTVFLPFAVIAGFIA